MRKIIYHALFILSIASAVYCMEHTDKKLEIKTTDAQTNEPQKSPTLKKQLSTKKSQKPTIKSREQLAVEVKNRRLNNKLTDSGSTSTGGAKSS